MHDDKTVINTRKCISLSIDKITISFRKFWSTNKVMVSHSHFDVHVQWKSHTRTILRKCCMNDNDNQLGRAKFVPRRPKPLNRSSPIFTQMIKSRTSNILQSFIQIGYGMSLLCMRDFAHRIVYSAIISFFSERELTFTLAICYRRSACLSCVGDDGAPYSAGWNFQQFFFAVWYLGHPLTSTENFTEIVPGEPLRPGV